MRRFAQVFAVVAIIGLAASVAPADTVTIYEDSFSGSGSLNGATPDVLDTNAAKWYQADQNGGQTGTIDGVARLPHGGVPSLAVLPFTPEAGHVYTVSADITCGASGAWGLVGFMESTTLSPYWYTPNIKSDWNLVRTGTSATVSSSLDTSGAGWTNTWPIYYVGVEAYNGDITVDNFKLTMTTAPEPSSVILMAAGMVSLLAYAWRRMR